VNKEQLIDFFNDFLMNRGIENSPQELQSFNFIGSGLLDSFEVLTMIMELEMHTGLKLTPEELVDESNATVEGLVTTLLSKQ
jgi:acyl carrier protein